MTHAIVRAAVVAALVLCTRPGTSDAFCGFYVSGAGADLFNDATQVVLMREGTRTVLSMQNNYKGPPENFAMVVPVPVVLQKDNVKTLDRAIFRRIDQLAAPRLVEYWEKDPCEPEMVYAVESASAATGGAPRREMAKRGRDLGVTIEAQFKVGEYEIVILSARDSTGLDTWLRQEKYRIPEGAAPFFKPYIQKGSKFFVAKVDVAKIKFADGRAALSPLRFHYDSDEFSLPVRLGLINSSGKQDLIVHILARGKRYELANYPNVTIPTNLDVADETRERFGEFYATLLDATLEKNPRAVVTEYAWDSASCDPCPTPPLTPNDLATLGLDVLEPGAGKKKPGVAPGRRRRMRFPGGFVLTRLHARYDKKALGDDLIFRAAKPIVGGREFRRDGKTLEQGATPSHVNNFQGRYAIRHKWTGKVECKDPIYGRWGGPPAGHEGDTRPKPALDLAFARRGKGATLTSFVPGGVPELAIAAAPAKPEPAKQTPAAGDKAAKTEEPQVPPVKKKSEGCAVAGSADAAPLGPGFSGLVCTLFCGLFYGLWLARRRRR